MTDKMTRTLEDHPAVKMVRKSTAPDGVVVRTLVFWATGTEMTVRGEGYDLEVGVWDRTGRELALLTGQDVEDVLYKVTEVAWVRSEDA